MLDENHVIRDSKMSCPRLGELRAEPPEALTLAVFDITHLLRYRWKPFC